MPQDQIVPDQLPSQSRRPRSWLTISLAVALGISLVAVAVLATLLLTGGDNAASDRTTTVSGEATIKATPDEYVFYPSYNFTNADKDAALKELSAKSDSVVAGLKKLGVADKDIKTNSSGYDAPVMYYTEPTEKNVPTYSLQLTVTVTDKALAQKAQNYLVTTSPMGGVSPQSNFSEAKRKQLENQARDQATQDARRKAEQSATNLHFKLGKVKSVTDGAGFGGIVAPMAATSMAAGDAAVKTTELAVQPGENSLSYSVTVVYEIH